MKGILGKHRLKSTLGVVADVIGLCSFAVTAITWILKGGANSVWDFLLQLNWVVGSVVTWLCLGWLAPIRPFIQYFTSLSKTGLDTIAAERGGKPSIQIYHVVILIAAILIVLIVAKLPADKSKRAAGVILVLYGAGAIIYGFVYAFTTLPEQSDSRFFIRLVGWVYLPLIAVHGGYLIINALRRLQTGNSPQNRSPQ